MAIKAVCSKCEESLVRPTGDNYNFNYKHYTKKRYDGYQCSECGKIFCKSCFCGDLKVVDRDIIITCLNCCKDSVPTI